MKGKRSCADAVVGITSAKAVLSTPPRLSIHATSSADNIARRKLNISGKRCKSRLNLGDSNGCPEPPPRIFHSIFLRKVRPFTERHGWHRCVASDQVNICSTFQVDGWL